MTPTSPAGPAFPATVPDVAGALSLLGMLASSELAAFTRLAADSALAPDLTDRLALAHLAGLALDSLDEVAVRTEILGGRLEAEMAPFAGVLVEFDRRTEPGTWSERLLKAYVGYGVADDLYRVLARAVDASTSQIVLEALADDGLAELVVDRLAAGALVDATLASRLALWGRRLFGEALGVVQRVVAAHPEVVLLLGRALPDGDPQALLQAELTAAHSRRMGRLGLTP